MKSTELACPSTTSWLWSTCGPWCNQTSSSWSIFPRNFRRIASLIENISSISCTRFIQATCSNWSDTLTTNVTLQKSKPELLKQSKWVKTGGSNWTKCLSFPVSTFNLYWSLSCFLLWPEHKGKTIHLLKSSSKPVPKERKRRKIEIIGTFQEY